MANLPELDAVADTVNGKTAEKLIAKVRRRVRLGPRSSPER